MMAGRILTLLWIALLCGGCAAPVTPAFSSASSKPVIEKPIAPTLTVPSPESTSTSLSSPYLSTDAQERFRELLYTNGGCDLPCFSGITPGQTDWAFAKTFLDSFNKIGPEEFYTDGSLPAYYTSLDFIDSKNRTLLTTIALTVGNGTVERLNISAETKDSGEDLAGYWSYYSIRKIFSQLGLPDQIFINVEGQDVSTDPGYGILILYKTQKDAFWLDGSRLKEVDICPEMESKYQIQHMQMSLAAPDANIGLLPPDWIPYTDSEFWKPIKTVLGVDEKEFYESLLADKLACFKVTAGP